MAHRAVIAGLAMALPLIGSAQAAESIYTKLDLDACKVLEEFEYGGVALQCPGLEGTSVFLSESDVRFSVGYGAGLKKWASFSPFNFPGNTVEWRVADDGRPLAAILRFTMETGSEPDAYRADALLVSTIATATHDSCAIGIVNASIDQANGVARGVAAMAATVDCDTHKPIYIGTAGGLTDTFTGAVPEGTRAD